MSSIAHLATLLLPHFNTLSEGSVYQIKKKVARDYGRMPKDSEVLECYETLLAEGKIQENKILKTSLITRKVRSESGVTPFAVMTKPYPCPGQCTYCPLEVGMPKSYLSDEPAAARAKSFGFDPARQISSRLKQLEITGHPTDKIEIIVIGGTFGSYPEEYKREFFLAMINTINDQVSDSLIQAQELNESSPRRIVGMSIETRPDWIDEAEVKLMRELGVTKVQLGVQALDDEIMEHIKRGHTLRDVATATQLLKDAGIKVCYHFMPNLPGSTPEHDLEMAHTMYEDIQFKPDFLKIYPVQVIDGTELYLEWERGDYLPYGDDLLMNTLKEIKKITPPFVRIDRLVRDISKQWVSAGTYLTNMRQLIHHQMKGEDWSCQCIRCREARGKSIPDDVKLCDLTIPTLGATEHLLTYEDSPRRYLYSLLRLRLPDHDNNKLFPELARAAIIREVHTYGTAVRVGKEGGAGKSQHMGLGKKLIKQAEQIAQEAGYSKIAVISAIGTRGYYRKLGYKLDGLYMTKPL